MLYLEDPLLVGSFFDFFVLDGSGQLLLEGACGLKMRTSKKIWSYLPPQKPLATMSKRSPSWMFEETPEKTSLVRGWRFGSTRTSWQTSVSRRAVWLRISLCLNEGKLPLGHERQ